MHNNTIGLIVLYVTKKLETRLDSGQRVGEILALTKKKLFTKGMRLFVFSSFVGFGIMG